MTSLDRARQFVAQKGKAIAVAIVPLASLAIAPTAARAVQPGFNTSNCAITQLPPQVGGISVTGSCVDVHQSAIDPTSGLLGVKVFANNSDLEPTATSGSGGTFGLQVLANSGGTIGMSNYSGTIPVSWNFTPTTSNQGNFSYLLTFVIGGVTKTEGDLTAFTNASGTNIQGVDSFVFASSTNITNYSIKLQVEDAAGCCNRTSLVVNIPSSSIDIAPPTTTGTPEPASVILFGSGFAGMLWQRLRRRRSS